MCRKRPERLGIVAEGDSWFSYPRKYLLAGPDINLLHHLRSRIAHTDTANLLIRSSNGDEAVQMLSGKQKYDLAKTLDRHGEQIDIVFFSGGGNDVVGRYDMDRLLNPYQAGFNAEDCLNRVALKRKMQRIELAYQELLELRNAYAPNATVVTHTYDIVKPSNKGAELLKFFKLGPWILPYLEAKGIPASLHMEISTRLLAELRTRLLTLADSRLARDKLLVIDTHGTLRPGHSSDWLNEIHPTASGFKRLFERIYQAMRLRFPQLPAP